MSAQQPEALQLAELLDRGLHLVLVERKNAAAELRRLHAENENLRMTLRVEESCSFRTQMQQCAAQRDELLEALREVAEWDAIGAFPRVHAVIAKVTGEAA